MGKYLRTRVMEYLSATCATFVPLSATCHMDGCPRRLSATPSTKGVRYFTTVEGVQTLRGAMDLISEGRKCHKRIVVRPSRHRKGLHELYTYHIPKTWSQACKDNRALMHEARLRAHAIERDHSLAALEWRVQHLANYYHPKNGIKPYARLFHYVYFVLQRDMRAALQNQPVEPVETAPNQPSEPTHYLEDLPIHVFVSAPTSPVPIPIDYYKYRQLHPPRAKNAKEFAYIKKL
ncbi:MAG: hypothetical protein IKD12_07870 [Paludibacteraceae bacterium]|nr:hypothetical protein [Paludibacteraceae bacterium]